MDFKNRRVTVMGLGNFGGGLGAVQFLVRQGARVTATDLRSQADLAPSLAQLADTPPEALHLGGHTAADFTDTDLVVVSPAVPADNHFLDLARRAGVPLTSEMNLFWELNPAPVVAITGSNGKSTTTAMTHAILEAAGWKSWLGGNIGKSLLPLVDQIRPTDVVVLELSSFQLEDLGRLMLAPADAQRQAQPNADGQECPSYGPKVAIVTNFSPNHLDRHGTLDNYRSAKQTLLRWQTSTDVAVLNQDDADVAAWPTKGRTLFFGLSDQGRDGLFMTSNREAIFRQSGHQHHLPDLPIKNIEKIPLRDWLTLPGTHNLQNALAAACAALALDVPPAAIEQGLRGYKALPHRLELVAEVAGRKFFNDSLATTPESAIVALAAFEQPIILFAGGYDKGSDLTDMARAIAASPHVKAVALMGTTGPRLSQLLDQFDPHHKILRTRCETFDEAFTWAAQQSSPGDILLLSPGCASYDWFQNFVDRGTQFRRRADASAGLLQG